MLGSGAALKFTPLKPEKSTEEPETAGDWIPLTPRARLGRGTAHTLTPLSPKNSVEGPGTAGEGTPLATSVGTERGAAPKLTPPTTNSGAGLGTEGACLLTHSQSQTRERGHTETHSTTISSRH
ncbi:hypothetical protein E2C01_092725 [Portunus trituberculatus]|uniref:Uncharacterized protein n=1 Tax=Portunus trituberculatus TaxID=210409 RepID=A0A5B7JL05_PORTR|nr:hypothetical protein [Portunus trituberculatus]